MIEKKHKIARDYDYNLFLLNEIKALNLDFNEKDNLQEKIESENPYGFKILIIGLSSIVFVPRMAY